MPAGPPADRSRESRAVLSPLESATFAVTAAIALLAIIRPAKRDSGEIAGKIANAVKLRTSCLTKPACARVALIENQSAVSFDAVGRQSVSTHS